MIRLRRLDQEGFAAYVRELLPRFLVLRVRAKGVSFRWAVPSWALEELMRFALRLLPLAPRVARYLPEKARRPVQRYTSGAGDRRSALAHLDEFFSENHRDLLVLPPGEPFVSIDTDDVSIEIKPYVLGVR